MRTVIFKAASGGSPESATKESLARHHERQHVRPGHNPLNGAMVLDEYRRIRLGEELDDPFYRVPGGHHRERRVHDIADRLIEHLRVLETLRRERPVAHRPNARR